MRALVADTFPSQSLQELRALVEVEYSPDVSPADLPDAASAMTILIVRGKQVARDVFEKGDALSLVIRAGAGVNTVDVAAASARGVYVANCPGKNSIAVAELTLGLLIAIDRRIPDNVAGLRAGKWDKKTYSLARGLFGRTLGIAGMGSIGREVASRARAFGMKVTAWSRSLNGEAAAGLGVDRAPDLVSLARSSDALSVHLPLNAGTRGAVSRDVLAALPDGGIFLNTARSEVVDQAALFEEAKSGRLSVGLDVYANEPSGGKADFHSDLAKLPNVYGTHHIGASTDQAQDAIADEAIRIVRSFKEKGVVPNCVNLARRTPARCQLIVRHQDKVGVLANVLDVIRRAGINAQEIENQVFEEAKAAICKIQLDMVPSDDVLAKIQERKDEVIHVFKVDL
jgi:D-3-phosphoglycerate dehydrogenase / 2-oxoglutarate reductase